MPDSTFHLGYFVELNGRMGECADVQMCKCANVQMCGCTNVQMRGCADVLVVNLMNNEQVNYISLPI